MSFSTDYQEILEQVNRFDPKNYARTRNHIRGAVSRLSPYISRGVISTKMLRDNLLERSYDLSKIEKFVQELAWRDYWQQIWIAKSEAIDKDLKRAQTMVDHHEVPQAIIKASTGIEAIDKAISEMYDTGYMHNHVRMYLAAITCNFGHSHWHAPALWHYYHLLDGDWASNALSWQWVAGSNAGKKYIADQQNVNRYMDSAQQNTFLDGAYDRFPNMEVPAQLKETTALELRTPLPARLSIQLNKDLPTYIYNWYNLDPLWDKAVDANRLLLLEPSVFEKYPISQMSLDFMLDLSKNIEDIQIAICEFDEIAKENELMTFHFKEHPLNGHYKGMEHPRDWLSNVTGYHSSFFAFWKKAKKEILTPQLEKAASA
jgi:deoxyribodipyrimidine photo-lyase